MAWPVLPHGRAGVVLVQHLAEKANGDTTGLTEMCGEFHSGRQTPDFAASREDAAANAQAAAGVQVDGGALLAGSRE